MGKIIFYGNSNFEIVFKDKECGDMLIKGPLEKSVKTNT